ncbi:OmpH family outer membrane protein [Marixanthomonas sp. SCSIO 43207]|uniref:OmpH family outer membrane protein n=1 Tax=Marixanthomonas sp. SCSIO 43207 TaxID=2779360 RepID=UPI001CA7BC23|nr:OmpH family outer membrane protein [Marixanthomonas sp. SCSIO 43207]UAB81007.1 OmpH family outer membrane protein [Marixanthomonas sp. SCSIO 43207]
MKYLNVLFLFVCLSGFSQTKVGTINVDYIISKMPELETVKKQVEEYGTKLDTDLQKKVTEYQAKIDAYKTSEASLTEEQKKEKQQEIIDAENDIAKFQQNGSKLISINRDEKMRPLYTKIGEALDKVAEAEGYTQILTANSSLAYYSNDYDVTLLVLKELGITVTEEE